MTTITAMKNLRYNKSRNILIGIAISLTTLLLFLVPSVGYNAILLQNGAVNETYSTWHAVLGNVEAATLKELKVCSGLDEIGLTKNVERIVNVEKKIDLYYFNQESLTMNRMVLEAGRLPERKDEIVLSDEIMQLMGSKAGIGDSIKIPYQLRTQDGLDYAVTEEFTVCGLLPESKVQSEEKSYMGLVSESFLQANVEEEDLNYMIYIQISGIKKQWMTSDIDSKIYQIADDFQIDKENIKINEQYLAANYIDSSLVSGIAGILLIIVIAGIITIYSIYYISMVQNIQEYGKLKAIGATKKQIRQIVLKEGMLVAVIAIPIGLLAGSLCTKITIDKILDSSMGINTDLVATMKELIDLHKVTLYHWQLYVLAVAVSLITVIISLRKPMKIVGNMSTVEAIKHHGGKRHQNVLLKGYDFLNIQRLAVRNLTDNKKRTVITIMSMAVTGILYIAMATVLSCTSPEDAANNRMPGEYEIVINNEEGNKEHPEYAWNEVQKNNPLTDNLINKIQSLEGVEEVDVFQKASFTMDGWEDTTSIVGLPKKYWNQVKKSIVEGKAEYSDLKSGEKVILNKSILYWYPNLKLGDRFSIQISDGDQKVEKTIEIIAIADVSDAIADYEVFITSNDVLKSWCENNQNYYFHVQAREKHNNMLEKQLQEVIGTDKRMQLATWESEYRMWESTFFIFNALCYGFIGILGAISIMNLINTMVNSIHTRKKELGIMQAIGLSEKQLTIMLQIESLVYTAGTLLISLGLGSLLGYGAFQYAKNEHLMNIRIYHFPIVQTLILVTLVVIVQLIISYTSGRFTKKEPLIDRIRLNE